MHAYMYNATAGKDEDQRAEHRYTPNRPVSVQALQELGLLYHSIENEQQVEDICQKRGYSSKDELTISPSHLPDYDAKIKIFFTEHIHEDEEIRYILGGSGYFDIRDKADEWIRIYVTKGDLIILPAGIYHRFTLDHHDYIHVRRLFKANPSWTPLNRPVDDNPFRVEYLESLANTTSAATSCPPRPWSAEELSGDAVSKRDLITWLHGHASNEFLLARKLNGQLKNVAKTQSKEVLIAAYESLFTEQAFRTTDEAPVTEVKQASTATTTATSAAASATETPATETAPLFSKAILKKGDRVNFPRKNDTVSVWYTGTLENGTVFDTNTEKKRGKKPQPLKFKVGAGRVIRGWDEGLLTMTKGEKAKLTIESEWAYGRKGLPDAGIGPNQRLIFEVELISID